MTKYVKRVLGIAGTISMVCILNGCAQDNPVKQGNHINITEPTLFPKNGTENFIPPTQAVVLSATSAPTLGFDELELPCVRLKHDSDMEVSVNEVCPIKIALDFPNKNLYEQQGRTILLDVEIANEDIVIFSEYDAYHSTCILYAIQNGETDVKISAYTVNGEDRIDGDNVQVHITADFPKKENLNSEISSVNMISAAPTTSSVTEYHPVMDGYTEKIMEWQHGDDIIAAVWEKKEGSQREQIMVLTGTGEMWKESDAIQKGNYDPNVNTYRNVKKIYVGEGITKVTTLSTGAVSVHLPNTIKVIGTEAFKYCSNLETVNLPEGLERIEAEAFARCDNLELPVFPSSLLYIGNGAYAAGQKFNIHAWAGKVLELPENIVFMDHGVFFARFQFGLCIHGENYKHFAKEGDFGWNYSFSDVEIETVYEP